MEDRKTVWRIDHTDEIEKAAEMGVGLIINRKPPNIPNFTEEVQKALNPGKDSSRGR
jgi:hypothetical protein